MSINASNNPYPDSPDASPTKLDKGGYDGTAETLDNKIDEILAEAKLLIDNTLVGSASLGSIIPSSVPPATGAVHAFATQAGTYTNWGGYVIPANTFALISRSSNLVFSISQTALDVSGKVNVSDVINTLASTETAKPLSANQGRVLDLKIAQGIVNWTAKAFLINDEVSHLGKLWQANAAIISTDVPSTSSKWTEILSGKSNLEIGKNLFNKATAVIGYFLSNTNNPVVSSTYDYSDFIAVTPGQQYVSAQEMRFTTYFNENKIYVAGGASAFTFGFTVPAGVYFVKVTLTHTFLNAFQLEKGSVATTFEAYYKSIPISEIPDLSGLYKPLALPSYIKDLESAVLGKNLYNKYTAIIDYFVNWFSGILQANNLYVASDFIPILPNTQYVSANLTHFAFYTNAKVFISGSNVSTLPLSPANAYFIRVSHLKTYIGSIQLELGSTATTYTDYGYTVPLIKSSSTGSNVSLWSGIETNCLGDSITAQNSWQPSLVINLGLSLTNFGIGGTTLAGTASNSMNNDSRVNALSNTAKLVIVLGGTNDWAQNYSLGLENSTTLTDFYGGLNVLITKLLTKYNTAGVLTKFLFIGTPYGELYDFVPRGWANAYTNTLGLTTKDYAEAIRKRCLFYGIPYCDTSNLGWNSINIRQYIIDDGGLLHPNANGGKRIAEVVIGKLKQIEPIL